MRRSIATWACCDTCDKRVTVVVSTRQVPSNDVVSDGKESAIRTFRALNSRFLTDAADPFVRAGDGVAVLAHFLTVEASRVHVHAAAEEGAKQRDLDFRRRRSIDNGRDQIHVDDQFALSGVGLPSLPTSSP